ncbi:MAG: peptide chain release factor N(5)-glutamine methyltransferase [Rhodothermia bacterium]|nr:peptide chain release factor N(5)-glutamine methyltransferase [Rhodothermia bacterium]
MTYRTLSKEALDQLCEKGFDPTEAQAEIRWLWVHLTGWPVANLLARMDETPNKACITAFYALLSRRMQHEPLQYILGSVPFLSLTLAVNPSVLIPRPETEWLTHWLALHPIFENKRYMRVLDVGTGSGCIALGLKSLRPDWEVVACDISTPALQVAHKNAEQNGLEVNFIHADMLAPHFPESFTQPFDLILSNPPYVLREEAHTLQKEVIAYEPHLALFTDGEPLRFYHALINSTKTMLNPNGWLAMECHTDFAHQVKDYMQSHGFHDVAVMNDLTERPRLVWGGWA